MSGRCAFTLLELLVCIAVIAILAALGVPVYNRAIQNGKTAACLSNMHQLGVALNLYLGDHAMIFPNLMAGRTSLNQNVPVIDNTLNAYAANPAIYACPADARGLAASTGTSYYWNTALDGQSLVNLNFLKIIEDHSRIPILADKEPNHPYTENKVNLLYADGHVTKDLSFFTGQ